MKNSNDSRLLIIILLSLVSFSIVFIRLLMYKNLHTTALLYLTLPFIIAIILIWFSPKTTQIKITKWTSYRRLMYNSMIVFFSTSLIIGEGFICILMFIPIYVFAITLVYLTVVIFEALVRDDHKKYSFVAPVFLLILGAEGLNSNLEFDRNNSITHSIIINASIADIHENLSQPIVLNEDRPWFLSIFPLPTKLISGSLNEGDIHEMNFDYYRWFITNRHSGVMKIQFEIVSDQLIKTNFIYDDSYLSNYLSLQSTEIKFRPINEIQTEVELTINYHRTLDPAWYFEPMQKYAISQANQYLLEQVITP